MKAVRWSDNDKYFGPFTYCGSGYRGFALVLGSGTEEYPRCRLRMKIGTRTLLVALPQWVLRPKRKKIPCFSWDAATVERLGRNWYWDVYEREYGFSYMDKAIHVYYGEQTHCWPGSKSKVFFVPWQNWRHVRTSHYGLQGEHYHTEPKGARWDSPEYEASRRVIEACPSVTFSFADFDGENINAMTTIQEREWHFGEGNFRWLSFFKKPKISRSLNIRFSSEIGPKKGSWKGGTVGHGIEMLDGENHKDAFVRYCAENNLKYGAAL